MNDITQGLPDKSGPQSDGHPTFDEADRTIEEAYLEDLARANAYADFIEEEAMRLAEDDVDESDPWTMGDQWDADGRLDS